MTKYFVFLSLCLFLVACNKDPGTNCPSSTQTQAEDSTTTAATNCTITDPATGAPGTTDDGSSTGTDTTDASLPNEALTFETNVTFFNTSANQEAKFEAAREIIKKVVATEEFRSRVLNHTYNGQKTFVDNGGLSNAQIYQKILAGAESLQPNKDNEMDLEVELYSNAFTSTVGYTYATSKRIWVNTKFFNGYTTAEVGHNLFHEWLHKLGFDHASSYSTSRDYSVPYGIGSIIGELGKKFL